jgi:hypothetical protein
MYPKEKERIGAKKKFVIVDKTKPSFANLLLKRAKR